MQLGCSKAFLEKLDITPDEVMEQDPLYQWSGHLKIVKRKNTLVVLHDESRFSFVLHGLTAKHFRNIGPMIIAGIRQSLLDNHISLKTVNEYMKKLDHISFSKSRGPKPVSRLNKVFEVLSLSTEFLNSEEIHQKMLNKRLNHYLVCYSSKEYGLPSHRIIRLFEQEFKDEVISCRSYDLTCRMELSNHTCWRRLIVPADSTFRQLHQILQKSFGWLDRHLYNFMVINEYEELVLKLITEHEEISNHEMNHSDGFITYTEYIEISTCLLEGFTTFYHYDYGDGWEIRIVVNDSNLVTSRLHPVCLMGEGDAPPDDVGGETGFDDFLTVMNDPSHPRYNLTREWAERQNYLKFSIETINKAIRYTLD